MNMTYTTTCKYQLPCGWCELRKMLCTQNGGITITPYWSDGTSGVVNTAVECKEESDGNSD